MQRIKDIQMLGLGGMNLDVSPDLIKPEDSRERYNCRSLVGEDGDIGTVSNIRSTLLVNSDYYDGSKFRVVKTVKDYKNNAIVAFICDTTGGGEHKIIRYYPITDTVELLLQHEILNFQDGLFIHANILGKVLYWTDGREVDESFDHDNYNPPRMMVMDKAKNYSANIPGTVFDRYFPNNDDTKEKWFNLLDRVKHPPKYAPWLLNETIGNFEFVNGYANDNDVDTNNLSRKLFQFRYRFVYENDEISTWSAISQTPIPDIDETGVGIQLEDKHINNVIGIKIETGTEIVHRIDIAVRLGSIGNWKLVDRLYKYDANGNPVSGLESDGTYNYYFYNDKVGEVLPIESVDDLFDYVPQISVCQEIIENNRMVDANFIEGYDNVDIDVQLNPVYNRIEYDDYFSPIENELIEWGQFGGLYYYKITIPENNKPGDILLIQFEKWKPWFYPATHEDVVISQQIVQVYVRDGDSREDIVNEFIEEINTRNTDVGQSNFFPCSDIRLAFKTCYPQCPEEDGVFYVQHKEDVNVSNMSFTFSYTVKRAIRTNPFEKWGNFKSERETEFGIVYYDRANRSGTANVSADSVIKIPTINERMEPYGQYITCWDQCLINWEIKHRPPEWATHYQWVKTKPSNWYLQFYIQQIIDNLADDRYEIILNQNIHDYKELFNNTNLEQYTWQKGDRIRFLAVPDRSYNEPDSVPYWDVFSPEEAEILDVEIIGEAYPETDDTYERDFSQIQDYIYDNEGNKKKKTQVIRILTPRFVAPVRLLERENVLVEVYRPVKNLSDEENKIFYEFGEVHEVGNPHTSTRYHKGGYGDTSWVRDQNPSTPEVGARGQFTKGDSYLRIRICGSVIFPCEDLNYSDFYESDSNSLGRVNTISREIKREQFISSLRYGGIKVQETQLNDLCRVAFDSFATLPEKYGAIKHLVEDGLTLVCRHPYKTHSIYIGRAGLRQAELSGREVVVTTDKILGTIYPWKDAYGCDTPTSDLFTGRYHYFVDINTGNIIRQADNGNMSISQKYGLNKWTKQVCRTIRESGRVYKINTGYQASHNEIYFSFYYHDGSDWKTETVVFNEDNNKWTHFIELKRLEGGVYNGPDYFEDIGDYFISFFFGYIWKHEAGNDYGTFYGTARQAIINLVGNINPKKDKTFRILLVDSNGQWFTDEQGVVVPENDGRREMLSELPAGKFKSLHGVSYAGFLKAGNTKTGTYTKQDLVNGRELRGDIIYIELKNESTDEVVLGSVTIESLPSELSG